MKNLFMSNDLIQSIDLLDWVLYFLCVLCLKFNKTFENYYFNHK